MKHSFDTARDEEDFVEIEKTSGNSFRDIVMSQFKNIANFSNVEFRGGFYNRTIGKDGLERSVYVPDSREIFCNSVFHFALIMQPKFDTPMKTAFKDIREEIDKLTEDFIEESSVKETVVLGDSFYKIPADKILLEEHKNKKLFQHQKLFARLSELLYRINYMETLGGTYI